MADVHTKEQRSFNMSQIRDKNTKPEIVVRKIVHHMGYRFRLHQADLAGKPDIVLPKHRKIIFVHGCFWHIHSCRYGKVKPKTNAKFWESKRQGNVTRDRQNFRQLRKNGWKILVIWECQTKDTDKLKSELKKFLSS